VQIAPAVGLAVVAVALVREPGRMRAIAAGLGAGLALVGVIEWLWWGAPFQGQWGYLAAEFAHGASTFFSREPVTFFVKNYVLMYGGLLPLVALLVWAGARRAPILLVAFLALVLPFHFVGHKEYRFVMVAAPVLVLLMGLGAADLWARFGSRARWGTALVALAGWLVAMTAMSLSDTFRPFWTTDRNRILAFRDIAEQPDACGVALVSMRWWHTPGYSGLGRDIPIYEILSADEEAQLLGAANYLLAGPKAPPPPPPWTEWRAYSRPVEYAYRRPGGCQPVPAAKVERPPLLPGLGP
jgi:hypothetical protein